MFIIIYTYLLNYSRDHIITLLLVQRMVLFNRNATLPVKMGVVSLYLLIAFIPLIKYHLRVKSILLSVQSLHKEMEISLHMAVLLAKRRLMLILLLHQDFKLVDVLRFMTTKVQNILEQLAGLGERHEQENLIM